MLRIALLAIALVTEAAFATASAQTGIMPPGIVPAPPYYAMSPGISPGPGGQSPVQQQMLKNYRTQLLQIQREMLQQNPSGLGPGQFEINRQLNMFNAAPPASYYAAPAPAPTPAAPPTYYTAPPAAYYAAPPRPRHAERRPAARRPPSDEAPSR